MRHRARLGERGREADGPLVGGVLGGGVPPLLLLEGLPARRETGRLVAQGAAPRPRGSRSRGGAGRARRDAPRGGPRTRCGRPGPRARFRGAPAAPPRRAGGRSAASSTRRSTCARAPRASSSRRRRDSSSRRSAKSPEASAAGPATRTTGPRTTSRPRVTKVVRGWPLREGEGVGRDPRRKRSRAARPAPRSRARRAPRGRPPSPTRPPAGRIAGLWRQSVRTIRAAVRAAHGVDGPADVACREQSVGVAPEDETDGVLPARARADAIGERALLGEAGRSQRPPDFLHARVPARGASPRSRPGDARARRTTRGRSLASDSAD